MTCIKHQAFCLISAIILFQSSADSASSSLPFFTQKWNRDFHLKPTETGDTLSIGAVFSNDSLVFVNDQAAGTVAVLNADGKILSKIPLEPIGRGTYSGDDFIVKDNRFVFVNTVDKKLEYFDRSTGKHIKSAALPTGVLAGQAKRSNRIIDRIFLVDKAILIGNGTLLFDLEKGLKKTASAVSVLKAAGTARYTLISGKKRFMTTGNFLADSASGYKVPVPASHYTIPGKRFFVMGGRLFSVTAAKEGIAIVECGLSD